MRLSRAGLGAPVPRSAPQAAPRRVWRNVESVDRSVQTDRGPAFAISDSGSANLAKFSWNLAARKRAFSS